MGGNYGPEDFEASLRRAFVDKGFKSIFIDGHELRNEFLRRTFDYGKEKGWLILESKLVDPIEILEPGQGQYQGWNYTLSAAGQEYFGLSK